MNVNDLISYVGLLCGLTLKSIRPGAEITILCVDAEKGNLILRTKSGENKSRPLSELVFLWNELQRKPAVHVDEALHGSGTSRNQPETILANLPYIEWLKIDGKKHIAYVGKRTHPFGTLQKMSAAETVKTMEAMHNTEVTPNSVIVDSDVNSVIHMLQRVSDGTVNTLSMGIYLFTANNTCIAIATPMSVGIEEGTYTVVEGNLPEQFVPCTLNGVQYAACTLGHLKCLVHSKS